LSLFSSKPSVTLFLGKGINFYSIWLGNFEGNPISSMVKAEKRVPSSGWKPLKWLSILNSSVVFDRIFIGRRRSGDLLENPKGLTFDYILEDLAFFI